MVYLYDFCHVKMYEDEDVCSVWYFIFISSIIIIVSHYNILKDVYSVWYISFCCLSYILFFISSIYIIIVSFY